MSKKIKVLFLSSIPAINLTGGAVQMYRHFKLYNDFDVLDINELSPDVQDRDSFFSRAEEWGVRSFRSTRLFPIVSAYEYCMRYDHPSSLLMKKIHEFSPDIIVTVAYGKLCETARIVAQKLKKPLITFFHDWWPLLASVTPWTRRVIERRFRRLYRDSDLALCVCEGMREALGSHKNSHVLYPIPDPNAPRLGNLTFVEAPYTPCRLLYTGNIDRGYGQMIRDLAVTLDGHEDFDLKVFGNTDHWGQEDVSKWTAKGVIHGFRPMNELYDEFSQADILVVVMSFEPEMKRFMTTSFPSKILDYCRFGKPILFWGPEYCTAVQFARKNMPECVVTSPRSDDCLKELQAFQRHPERFRSSAQGALELSKSIFDPNKIHSDFVNHIVRSMEK